VGGGHKEHVFTAGFHLVAGDFNLDVDVGRAVVADKVPAPLPVSETRCIEAVSYNWGHAIDLDGDGDRGYVLVGSFAAALGRSGNDNTELTGS
jgi:hypothetical protein